jgi:hypothetical protein
MNAIAALSFLKSRTISTAASIMLIILISGSDGEIKNKDKGFNVSLSVTYYHLFGNLQIETGLINGITSFDNFYQPVIRETMSKLLSQSYSSQ